MRFAADQVVTLLDRHHALDDGREGHRQRLQRLVGEFVANRADNRPGDPAHYVGLVTALPNLPEDGRLLLPREVGFQNNNHICCFSWLAGGRHKKPQAATCGGVVDFRVPSQSVRKYQPAALVK